MGSRAGCFAPQPMPIPAPALSLPDPRSPSRARMSPIVEMPTQPRPHTQRLVGTAADELHRVLGRTGDLVLAGDSATSMAPLYTSPVRSNAPLRKVSIPIGGTFEGFCRVGTICVSASPGLSLWPQQAQRSSGRLTLPQQPDRTVWRAGLVFRSGFWPTWLTPLRGRFPPAPAPQRPRAARDQPAGETTQPRRAHRHRR